MNYRHHFHAGSLADLVKHITLCHLLDHLNKKPSPYCVIDTHAAAGLYDLTGIDARKTGEAQLGIDAYRTLPPHPSHRTFRDVLEACGESFYPGSPAIIQKIMREQDRLMLTEKHPEEARKLQKNIGTDSNITIHQRDAWEAMRGLIPVKEGRLLVFIDPPYEAPDEFEQAFDAIKHAHSKASHAIFALWYPLKDPIETGRLQERFATSGMKKILRADVPFSKDVLPSKMNGSGMIIINPPYQLEQGLCEAYQALMPLFPSAPAAHVDWLAGE